MAIFVWFGTYIRSGRRSRFCTWVSIRSAVNDGMQVKEVQIRKVPLL